MFVSVCFWRRKPRGEDPHELRRRRRPQRRIAGILGALDDRIELNRRMSEPLEATARALFKSWFVDFYPVPANASGPETRDRPALPEGWRIGSVYEIADVVYGAPYREVGADRSGRAARVATALDILSKLTQRNE